MEGSPWCYDHFQNHGHIVFAIICFVRHVSCMYCVSEMMVELGFQKRWQFVLPPDITNQTKNISVTVIGVLKDDSSTEVLEVVSTCGPWAMQAALYVESNIHVAAWEAASFYENVSPTRCFLCVLAFPSTCTYANDQALSSNQSRMLGVLPSILVLKQLQQAFSTSALNHGNQAVPFLPLLRVSIYSMPPKNQR